MILREPLQVVKVGLKALTALDLTCEHAQFITIREFGNAMAHHFIPVVLPPGQLGIARVLELHKSGELVCDPFVVVNPEEILDDPHKLQASDLSRDASVGWLTQLVPPLVEGGDKLLMFLGLGSRNEVKA